MESIMISPHNLHIDHFIQTFPGDIIGGRKRSRAQWSI